MHALISFIIEMFSMILRKWSERRREEGCSENGRWLHPANELPQDENTGQHL